MRIALFDHQRKSQLIVAALHQAGHEFVTSLPVDVLLIDTDHAEPRLGLIDTCHAAGATVLIYQHGALPEVQYDGIYPGDPRVTASLVHAPGIADIYQRCGYPHTCHVIGWAYSPMLPFTPPERIRHVLFAPLHPFGDGRIADRDRDLNWRVADELARLNVDVTVQAYMPASHNGFAMRPGWSFAPSNLDLNWEHVDRADAVIGSGTLAYLALARGKPTVMIGTGRPIYGDDMVTPTSNWDTYAPLLRYPLDAQDGPLADLLEAARVGSPDLDAWRARMVGEPFRPDAFCALVERLAATGRPDVGMAEPVALAAGCNPP